VVKWLGSRNRIGRRGVAADSCGRPRGFADEKREHVEVSSISGAGNGT